MANRVQSVVLRGLAVVVLATAGIGTIVGSGGGSGGADFFGGDPCANGGCNVGPIYVAFVAPARSSVQAGSPVVLTATSAGITNPTYQWRRSIDGVNFTDIAGETNSTYRFTARLVDDATTYQVRVAGTVGVAAVATSYLVVSSSPAIAFSDSEFPDAGWTSTNSSTSPSATVASEGQEATGGNPGAWRHTVVSMPAGTSTINVFNVSSTANFDPGSQGALRAIDYSQDCTIKSSNPSTFGLSVLLVQNGRSFAQKNLSYCNAPGWVGLSDTALGIADFTQVAGPACTANELCPDFSTSGTAIRLGYLIVTTAQGSATAATFDRGADNWRVSLWRR